MTNDSSSPTFDWVTARAKCNAHEMFEVLRVAARANVTTRNQLIGADPTSPKFGFTQQNQGVFTVWSTLDGHSAVDFSMNPDGETLEITPSGSASVVAAISLADSAVCKLKIGDDLLCPWQVLRRFLEPLFFKTP